MQVAHTAGLLRPALIIIFIILLLAHPSLSAQASLLRLESTYKSLGVQLQS